MEKDVVCGMGVDKSAPESFVKTYRGIQYYFCSPDCMTLFMKNPESYIQRAMEPSMFAKDPICGMEVDSANPPYTSQYGGVTWYFCSMSCKVEFDLDPEQYR